jgi:hypothetical protein
VKSKEFGKAPSSGLQPTRLGRATGITAIWGIWCCFIQPGRAQVARPSASSNSASNAKTARSVYITEPIDPGLSALPANFQGHDIETIYKFLQASKGAEPKSEFETTEHYNQRQDASAVQPILGTLTASSIFGFVLSEASAFAGELSIKYDADDGKMTIILDPQVKTLYLERDNPEVEIISIKTNEISHDTYTGSNAFGATRLITRSYLESYGVAFSTSLGLDVTIPMPPEEAQLTKPNLRVLLVCTLDKPWIMRDVVSVEPKIDQPVDITNSVGLLKVKVKEIWVFDQKTGAIFKKVSYGFPSDT